MKIKIAHIHGGEVTSGAFDDNIRHAITKFSNHHFATHKTYKKRLIQLGENPKNVYLVGSPGVENFKKYKLIDKEKLFKELSLNIEDKKILITFHPETYSDLDYEKQIDIIIKSIKNFKKEQLIFTFNNSDPYGHIFLEKIKRYVKTNKNIKIFSSLGSLKYLSLLKNVDLVMGNSSSGVIEAPATKVPTLNIGTRQKGRVAYDSIINCELNSNKIQNAINKILYKKIKIKKNIIGNFNTSKLIYSKLNKILGKKNFDKKTFYDIKFKN